MLNSMKYEATREEQKRKSTPQRSFMDVLDDDMQKVGVKEDSVIGGR